MTTLLLYYSGVGNTKRVAQMISENITPKHKIEVYSIEKLPNNFSIEKYSSLIIGFPTIHSSPAKPILKFVENMPILEKPIGTFIYTTCGLYSTNSLRIFSKICVKKNIIPILNKSYRCSATDGVLLAPFMKCWFSDEKNLNRKVRKDSLDFLEITTKPLKTNIPKFKLYSILNYPNKIMGTIFPFKIYLHKEKCIKCGKCVLDCPVKAYDFDSNNFPNIDHKKCISCFRCIHKCPKKALSIFKKKSHKKTLYY